MERAPLVSIVTPSFNQGRFIRATIESVLAQDYPRVEYLVIDGGSTDTTARIVSEYRDRLTWISEPDRGQAHAINKGFLMARGEIVAWLNSDDLLLPQAVSSAVQALEADRDLALVYGGGYMIDEEGFVQASLRPRDHDSWQLANVLDYIVQPAAFFRPWALRQVGYLDESLHWCLDWDLFLRFSRRWPMRRLDEPLAAARVHDDAKTESGGFRRFREIRTVVRRYADGRFPPAVRLYGCETVSTMTRRWIRRTLGKLGLDGETLADAIDAAAFGAVRQNIQSAGLYEDGWVSRRAAVVLGGDGDALELTGFVPPVFGRGRPQRIELHLEGRRLGTFEVPPGDFTLTLPIGAGRERHLTVYAARTFSGARRRINDDRRRLAFRLLGAHRRPAAGVDVWHASGRYSDGWMGPVLRLRTETRGRSLRLRGRVPPAVRQRLELCCDGRMVASPQLGPGDFDLTVPVGEHAPPIDLELRARRPFVMDERPASRRRLGLWLHEITWAEPTPGGAVLGPPMSPRAGPFGDDPSAIPPFRAKLLATLRRRANRAGPHGLLWTLLHPARTLSPDLAGLRRRGQTRRRRTSTFWGAPLTVHPPEVVSVSLLRWGVHDPELSAVLIRALRRGQTFFDVGAHFGYFSVLADHVMEGAGEIHSFEPTPTTFAVLAENVRDRSTVRTVAVAAWKDGAGAEIRDHGIALSAFNSLHGARIPGLIQRLHQPTGRKVPTITLDDYCRATGARPDFVKVTTEGAELEILQGMAAIVLPEMRPFVVLEVGDMGVAGVAPSRLLVETMLSHGYTAWELRHCDVVPHEPAEHYACGNLLFVPRP